MPCETIPKQINGETWTVTQMPPTQALELEIRLAPVLMQGGARLFAAFGKGEAEQDAALQNAIVAMTDALPAKDLVEIIKGLCSQCFRNGERVVFEKDFQGGAGVMLRYQVAWFVLEANFADFFGAMLPDGMMDRAKALYDEKTGPAESIGESGDPVSPTPHSAA